MERSTMQQRISKILRWLGDLTSRAGVAAVLALLIIAYAIRLAAEGFPRHGEIIFQTVVAVVTLVMVFVIQHTQSRQQVATQLKLDELIRAIPNADNLLVHIEAAGDDELIEREKDHVNQHTSLRE
jgi:low affinity Fe/Cu permease